MSAAFIGLDLAKSVFQVHGVDAQGKVVMTKRLRRDAVLAFFVNLPPCVIGMEACAGSHFWARDSVMRWTSPSSGAAAPFDGQDVFSSGRWCNVGGVHRSRSGEVSVSGSRR